MAHPKRYQAIPLASLLLVAALAMSGGGSARAAGPLFTLGGGATIFSDDRINDLYGTRPAMSLSLEMMRRRWVAIGLKGAYSFAEAEPVAVDFITSTKTKMSFVPISLYAHAVHLAGPSLQLYGGPQVGYVYFSESWSAGIASLELKDHHQSSGSWISYGIDAGLRLRITDTGGLEVWAESMWARADREAVPGNDSQTTSMTPGWYGVRVGWFWAGSGWQAAAGEGGEQE